MRPETGPMKFGDDWRGVFIRGDSAFNYAMHLERLMKHQPPGDAIGMMVIRELHDLLSSSDERRPDGDTQRMRSYPEAVANHEAAEPIRKLGAFAEEDPSVTDPELPDLSADPSDCAPTLDHGQAPERGES